jgi:hypothetical protein
MSKGREVYSELIKIIIEKKYSEEKEEKSKEKEKKVLSTIVLMLDVITS